MKEQVAERKKKDWLIICNIDEALREREQKAFKYVISMRL